MAAPTSKRLHVQTTWTYLTYLQYFSTPGGMYYSICTYYSIYNMLVISDAKFLCWGDFCVGTNMHVNPKLATFRHVADVLPTCRQHSQLSYCLVWATKLSLAAIGLVFPALVLEYKSFNCSMYHVPVPTLFG